MELEIVSESSLSSTDEQDNKLTDNSTKRVGYRRCMAIVGAIIGVCEIIFSSLENLHSFGLQMGIYCFLISGAIFFVLRKSKPQDSRVVELERWLHSELPGSISTESDVKTYEANKAMKHTALGLIIFFCVFGLFVLTLATIRLLCLIMH